MKFPRFEAHNLFPWLAVALIAIVTASTLMPFFSPARAASKGKLVLAWHAGFASRWLDPQEHDGTATPLLVQPCGHARGGSAHQRAVHPVGARAERSAETGRAELEALREALPQPVEIAGVEQRVYLRSGDRVRVLVAPRPRLRMERVLGHSRATTWATRSPIASADVWPTARTSA